MSKKPNYLVTGGAGFIGSHLCDCLLAKGGTVTAIDDLSLGRPDNLTVARKSHDFNFVRGDILNGEVLDLLFEGGDFDAVFHLAANSDIQRGSRETDRDLNLTFLTTFRILNAMKEYDVKEIIFASSSAIYGETDRKINEEYGPLQPVSFYGAAKNAAESYISSFVHHFGIRAWIVRFPNVVGSRLTHGVVYDFINNLMKDPTKLVILGDGEQRKPYLHVDDLIDAILLYYRKSKEGINCVNIGVESRTSVKKIAEFVAEEMGLKDAVFRFTGGSRGWMGDVPSYQYDLTRIKRLGWEPRFTSDEALRESIRENLGR